MRGRGLASSGSGQEQVAGCCDHENERYSAVLGIS
jgi:hypothetical protein